MTLEEALAIVTAALAPRSLNELQTRVFRGVWNKQSYLKIALELNHKDGYIKDVGAELWQLLTQTFQIKVTKLNLQEALAQYAQQGQRDPSAFPQRGRVDWGEAPDVSQFYGRQAQLATLEQWVMHDRCRTVAIVGIGGIGKTKLTTRLVQQIAEQFEIVVWRSLRQAPLLAELLTELVQTVNAMLKGNTPHQSPSLQPDAAMRQLLEQLRHHRCLLILDNVETVLCSNELVGAYRSDYEDYGWLFQQVGEGRHQSTVLLTSREIPKEIAIQAGLTTPVRLMRLKQLSVEEGEAILVAKGLVDETGQPLVQELQLQELIERYRGNPLMLQSVATLLKELFNCNIATFLAQETLLFEDIRSLLAQQFDRLSALERQVMYQLAIHRRAVTAAQLQADLPTSVSQVQLRDALVSLARRSLIEIIKPTSARPTSTDLTLLTLDEVSYTQQPVVMEYVTEQLIEQVYYEMQQAQVVCLKSHTLLKTQAKDCVRDVQR